MDDRYRMQRCSWCHVQLIMPPEAQSFRCAVCQYVTPVRGHDPVVAAVKQAAGIFRGLVSNISSGVNMLNAATSSGYAGQTVPCYENYPPLRPLLLPPWNRRKRALLCGVSYRRKSYALKGTVNDVRCMRYFLTEKMGFPGESILTLTEDETNQYLIPTKQNILSAMNWLVQGCRSGDSLVFHFSGHGSRQRDDDMDEIDGYDECLCPADFEVSGRIVDDDINAILVRPLPNGAKLHAIIDTCYSGTMFDLPFLCRMNREGYYTWEDQRRPLATYKGTYGGIAISFSACDDHQISADTTALSGNVMTGAMTYSFIQAMEKESGLTYGCLLITMRNCIRDTRAGLRLNGPVASFLNRLIGKDLSQEPQLSSSTMFDIYKSEVVL